MRNPLLLSLALFTITSANAQEQAAGHYLFNEFKEGIGHIRQGLPIKDKFNYDVVNQEMHFIDGFEALKLDMPALDTLYIDNRKFVQTSSRFAELIRLDNGIELYIFWHSRELEKGRVGANGLTTTAGGVYNLYVGDVAGEHAYQDYDLKDINVYNYVPQNTYIAKVKGKNVKFTNVKSFARVFKMQQVDVEAILEKNKWSFSKAADVVALLSSMEFK